MKRNKSGRFFLTATALAAGAAGLGLGGAYLMNKVSDSMREKTREREEAQEKLERDSRRILFLLFNKQG